MYHRPFIIFMKYATGALSVLMELLSFYNLFRLFDSILSGHGTNYIYEKDVLYFAMITALSAFCYVLIESIILLGDRLEAKGETVWIRKKNVQLQKDLRWRQES